MRFGVEADDIDLAREYDPHIEPPPNSSDRIGRRSPAEADRKIAAAAARQFVDVSGRQLDVENHAPRHALEITGYGARFGVVREASEFAGHADVQVPDSGHRIVQTKNVGSIALQNVVQLILLQPGPDTLVQPEYVMPRIDRAVHEAARMADPWQLKADAEPTQRIELKPRGQRVRLTVRQPAERVAALGHRMTRCVPGQVEQTVTPVRPAARHADERCKGRVVSHDETGGGPFAGAGRVDR